MWKILHKLFGWHYIAFEFASEHVVSRVKQTPVGTRYVKAYGNFFWLDPNGKMSDGRTYVPLTWNAEQ